jgi:hypothetical protein
MDGLIHLYPKLSRGGYVIIDDFGSILKGFIGKKIEIPMCSTTGIERRLAMRTMMIAQEILLNRQLCAAYAT